MEEAFGTAARAGMLAGFALLGAVLDMARGRVPGWCSALALMAGLGLGYAVGGLWGPPGGLWPALLTAAAALALFSWMRGLGGVAAPVPWWAAGLAALCGGGELALSVLAYSALCGLALGVAILIRRGRLAEGLASALRGAARFRYGPKPSAEPSAASSPDPAAPLPASSSLSPSPSETMGRPETPEASETAGEAESPSPLVASSPATPETPPLREPATAAETAIMPETPAPVALPYAVAFFGGVLCALRKIYG